MLGGTIRTICRGAALAALGAGLLCAGAGVAAAQEEPAGEPADALRWEFDWDNGFKLDRSDGAFKLGFGGRLQTDFAVIDYTGLDGQDDFDSEGFGAEFRRARIYFKGLVYGNVLFKVNYDFAGGDSDFKDVYVGLRFPEEHLDVLVGHYKQVFSYEGMMSSNHIIFMERPTQGVFLGDRRDTGVVFLWHPSESMLVSGGAYLLADAFGDSDPTGGFGQENDRYAFSTRVAGAPVYEDDGASVFHIGAGYAHWIVGDPDAEPNFDVPPEVHLADDFIRTDDLVDSRHVDFVNGEVMTIQGPLMIQSEIVGVFVTRRNGMTDPDFWGAYGQVSYLLTGEHHNYESGPAHIGRLEPKENFSTTGPGWGAWEVAGRLSYTDASDDDVKGGEVLAFATAVNWYLTANLRWQLNYVHAYRKNTRGENGRINAVETRLNFQF